MYVQSISDIITNTNTLEQYLLKKYNSDDNMIFLSNENDSEYLEALSLIQKGVCFVVIKEHETFKFCPSRFVGYKNNTLEKHSNSYKHGGETNKVISRILGDEPRENSQLEQLYKRYCNTFDSTVSDWAKKKRRFWLIDLDKSISIIN